jgi:hypothetical protein
MFAHHSGGGSAHRLRGVTAASARIVHLVARKRWRKISAQHQASADRIMATSALTDMARKRWRAKISVNAQA